jgi:hypothetical protein
MLTNPCAQAVIVRPASSASTGPASAAAVRRIGSLARRFSAASGRHASGCGAKSSRYAAGCAWVAERVDAGRDALERVAQLAQRVVGDQPDQGAAVAHPLVQRGGAHADRRRDALHGQRRQPVGFEDRPAGGDDTG